MSRRYEHTHGRCRWCKVIWRWLGRKPLVRDAHCHVCGEKLGRTAAALVSKVKILDGNPVGADEAQAIRAKRHRLQSLNRAFTKALGS